MNDVNHQPFICGSPTLRAVESMARRVAPSKITVLITGETGVGKEVFAHLIHKLSGRKGDFVAVNCCAISRDLFESEMFGSLKGAYTSSDRSRSGLIESAESGTLYLDEIGDMPIENQVKLLRFLESREYRPVGGLKNSFSTARIVASTNADLQQGIIAGKFRQDLLYRLNHFNLNIPPLRERKDELPLLVNEFARQAVLELTEKEAQWPVDPKLLDLLQQHSWPGNLRELKHLVFRMVLMSERARLGVPEATAAGFTCAAPEVVACEAIEGLNPRQQAERNMLLTAFTQCGGNLSKMAVRLALSRQTLYAKLDIYGIRKVRPVPSRGRKHMVIEGTPTITHSTTLETSGKVETL